jgi:hypothetical protein
MLQTVEAVIENNGQFHFLEPFQFTKPKRALITFLYDDNEPVTGQLENALLSEEALGKDWNKTEEDEAWSHLQ